MNKNYITLKKLRIPELKLLCKENKIRGFSKLRKQGIVELLFKNLYPKEQKVLKVLKEELEVSGFGDPSKPSVAVDMPKEQRDMLLDLIDTLNQVREMFLKETKNKEKSDG